MPGTFLEPKSEEQLWREHQQKREEDRPPLSERDEPPAVAEEPKAQPQESKKDVYLLTFMDKMIGWYPETEQAEQALFHVIDDFAQPGPNPVGASAVRGHFAPAYAGGHPRDQEALEKLEEFITDPSRGYWRKRFAQSVLDIRQYWVSPDWEHPPWGAAKPEGDIEILHDAARVSLPKMNWDPWHNELVGQMSRQLEGEPEKGEEDDETLTVMRPYWMESVRDWMHGREPKKYPG
jgi:hypothetical protein